MMTKMKTRKMTHDVLPASHSLLGICCLIQYLACAATAMPPLLEDDDYEAEEEFEEEDEEELPGPTYPEPPERE